MMHASERKQTGPHMFLPHTFVYPAFWTILSALGSPNRIEGCVGVGSTLIILKRIYLMSITIRIKLS